MPPLPYQSRTPGNLRLLVAVDRFARGKMLLKQIPLASLEPVVQPPKAPRNLCVHRKLVVIVHEGCLQVLKVPFISGWAYLPCYESYVGWVTSRGFLLQETELKLV